MRQGVSCIVQIICDCGGAECEAVIDSKGCRVGVVVPFPFWAEGSAGECVCTGGGFQRARGEAGRVRVRRTPGAVDCCDGWETV